MSPELKEIKIEPRYNTSDVDLISRLASQIDFLNGHGQLRIPADLTDESSSIYKLLAEVESDSNVASISNDGLVIITPKEISIPNFQINVNGFESHPSSLQEAVKGDYMFTARYNDKPRFYEFYIVSQEPKEMGVLRKYHHYRLMLDKK